MALSSRFFKLYKKLEQGTLLSKVCIYKLLCSIYKKQDTNRLST